MCALKRVKKDLYDLIKNPVEFCSACPDGSDVFHWNCIILGPQDTPYYGGMFFFVLTSPVIILSKPLK